MSYTVLALKWRPRRFQDLVGQQHVVQALVNSLAAERLHHAYLFTGTRGVGKTTVARILAKALNCEQGVVAEPCGVCAACTAIDQGRFVDLIEVDAASRTKVDDTRELLDNVQYAPSRGRYKVYLIDEVHMLSNHSFNALLKTLEEPPPHVKFLFATTDPQKLPITVLSRCLQFNLKRLTASQIETQLEKICTAEGISAEPAGLKAIARAADGSMRDGLSILDQGLAFGGGEVRAELIDSMLGTIDRGHVRRLLEALAAEDGGALLDEIDRLDERAPDYASVLDELMEALQQMAVIQLVGDRIAEEDLDALKPLAAKISPEDVQLYYQIALQGKRDLPVGRDPRAGFEMTMLRMLAFRPQSDETAAPGTPAKRPATPASGPGDRTAAGRPSSRPASSPGTQAPESPRPRGSGPAVSPSAAPAAGSAPARASDGRAGGTAIAAGGAAAIKARLAQGQGAPAAQSAPAAAQPARRAPLPDAPPVPDDWRDAAPLGPADFADEIEPAYWQDTPPEPERPAGKIESWASLVQAADVRGAARQLADHCELGAIAGSRVDLVLSADKEALNTPQVRTRLQAAIGQHLGRPVTLTISPGTPPRPTPAEVRVASENARMRRAREAIEQDPNVKAVQEAFGAVLEADTIEPREGS